MTGFAVIACGAAAAAAAGVRCAQSRRHWLSARVYKRQLLLGYMVFNSALYGGQLILYTLLFLPSFNQASTPPLRAPELCVLVRMYVPSRLVSILARLGPCGWRACVRAVVGQVDGLFAFCPPLLLLKAPPVVSGWLRQGWFMVLLLQLTGLILLPSLARSSAETSAERVTGPS